jgi:large subunit ribosomal protein L29
MELEKIKQLNTTELKHEETVAAEQLFRLRFKMKLGQTEGVKKIRGLRKDIARMKTIARQQELGIAIVSKPAASAKPAKKTKKGSR